MAEIMNWNNAFSGQGSPGSIGVSGMSLPNPGDASGASAFSEMFRAGMANRVSRQNLLMQQQAMEMQRQKFSWEMSQDMNAMMLKQREMAQQKLFGSIFNKHVDSETGKVDYMGIAADVSEVPELAGKAPEFIAGLLTMNKLDAEALKVRLDTNMAMHTTIGKYAGSILSRAKEEGRNVQAGEVLEAIARAQVAGEITKEYAGLLVTSMSPEGPALDKQVQQLWETSEQSAQSISSIAGSLVTVNQGGQTSLQQVKVGPGGASASPVQTPGGAPAVFPDMPTSAANSQLVESIDPQTQQIVKSRVSDIPAVAPVPGGLPSTQGPAPAPAPQEGPSAMPQAMPSAQYGLPQQSLPGMAVGPSPESVDRRKQTEETFRKSFTAVNEGAQAAVAQGAMLDQAKDALSRVDTGGLTSFKLPIAKMLAGVGMEKAADKLAGGGLADMEVLNAKHVQMAFAAIKAMGVTNRDLSQMELELSKQSTFGPDKMKETNLRLIDYMKDFNTMQLKRQKAMAFAWERYNKNPADQRYDLLRAEAKINAHFAKPENGGWIFGQPVEETTSNGE